MTTLRRYLFALVAVCVAFASGIALGNGPLQGSKPADESVSLAGANAELADQVSALRRDQAFSRALGSATRLSVLHARLAGTSVGIFVIPGVPRATVTAVRKVVAEAGAEVTVQARLSAELVDPAKKTYVDSVAANSLKGVTDLEHTGSAYVRIGRLISRAYTGTLDALAVDDEATRIDAQLRGAKLVSLDAPLLRRSNAVIVLTPGEHGNGEAVYAAHSIEVQLLEALAAGCDGVLLAGPAPSSQAGGLIFAVTNSAPMKHAVSTLNVIDSSAGRIAAVGALSAAVTGKPGSYGMLGSVPAVPPGLGTMAAVGG